MKNSNEEFSFLRDLYNIFLKKYHIVTIAKFQNTFLTSTRPVAKMISTSEYLSCSKLVSLLVYVDLWKSACENEIILVSRNFFP